MQQTLTTQPPIAQPDSATTRDLITIPVFLIYIWTFIHIGRPQEVFPALGAFNPGDIIAGLSILSFIFWGEKDQPVFSFPETKLFLLFFLIAIIISPFAYYKSATLGFFISFFWKVGIFLYLVTKLISTPRRIDGLIKTIMLSGFLMAVATVLSQQPGIRAAFGATYDPNDMAMLMVVTLPLSITQSLQTSNKSWKIICYSGAVFCLLALIATISRGGFLGLLAVGLFMLKTKMPGLPKKKLILVGGVLGIIFISVVGQNFTDRMATILEDVTDRRAGSGRILIWERSLVMFFDHPILGVGPSCFISAYGNYLKEGKFKGELAPKPGEWAPYSWSVAHSAYLTVLVEFGIIGFIIYINIILRTFRNLNKVLMIEPGNSQREIHFISTGIKISLFGFLTCALFLSQAYNPVLYIYFFISGNLLRKNITTYVPNSFYLLSHD